MSVLRTRLRERLRQRRHRRGQRLLLTLDWQCPPVAGLWRSSLSRVAALAWLGQGRARVAVTLVSSEHSQQLNRDWRGKDKPTNILSFPFEAPPGGEKGPGFLGDLVICPQVVLAEASAQGKSVRAHLAHLLVHGLLHLQGYDHEQDAEALEMEALEIDLLQQAGIANPYAADAGV